MVGEDYAEQFAVTGHIGSVTFFWYTGTVPPGLRFDATGALSGKPTLTGAYSFEMIAVDSLGRYSVSEVKVNVLARAVTAENRDVTVPLGSTPVPVNLTEGATGGPFDGADVISIEPSDAGTARITGADVAGIESNYDALYLRFTPNPRFGGTASVTYQLLSASGPSNPAVVSYSLTADPTDLDAVAETFAALSQDFVTARAGLLSSGISEPSVRDRRGMGSGTAPGSLSGTASGNSATLNFAGSTLELEAFQAVDRSIPVDTSGLNFWIDGSATVHVRNDDEADSWGSFALVSAGADVLVDENLLVGLAVHSDWMEDLTDISAVYGRGVLVGPYLSVELSQGLFFDASAYYGRSWNSATSGLFNGDFETERLLVKARLEGEMALSDLLMLRPSGTVFYLREEAGAYSVSDGTGAVATVEAFATEQLRLSGGARLEYVLGVGDDLTAVPYGELKLGLMVTDGSRGVFGNLGLGAELLGLGDWRLTLGADAGLDSHGFRSIAGKLGAGVRF